jgi:hypothetical protein
MRRGDGKERVLASDRSVLPVRSFSKPLPGWVSGYETGGRSLRAAKEREQRIAAVR